MSLIKRYADWLMLESSEERIGECTIVAVPFLNRHRDYMELYVVGSGDFHSVSDEGETLLDLKQSYEWSVETDPEYRDCVNSILKSHGLQPVSLLKQSISSGKVAGNFAETFHCVLSAMLEIDGLAQSYTPPEEQPR